MENYAKIDASPSAKGVDRDLRAELPKSVSDFEVLLSRYQKQSPEQYEKKLANGTFEKQAKALGIAWEPKPAKEVEEPKAEKEVEEVKEPKAKSDKK